MTQEPHLKQISRLPNSATYVYFSALPRFHPTFYCLQNHRKRSVRVSRLDWVDRVMFWAVGLRGRANAESGNAECQARRAEPEVQVETIHPEPEMRCAEMRCAEMRWTRLRLQLLVQNHSLKFDASRELMMHRDAHS